MRRPAHLIAPRDHHARTTRPHRAVAFLLAVWLGLVIAVLATASAGPPEPTAAAEEAPLVVPLRSIEGPITTTTTTTTVPPTTTTTAPPPPTTTTTVAPMPPPTTAPVVRTGTCQGWGDLLAAYFPPEQVDKACSVMLCESGGDPTIHNASSSASGLFQFLDSTWTSTTGQPAPASAYSPEAQIGAAARLWQSSGWSPWMCA